VSVRRRNEAAAGYQLGDDLRAADPFREFLTWLTIRVPEWSNHPVGCLSAAYVRTVKTASGAIAVRIAYSMRRGSRTIEHLGSAHDEQELEGLKRGSQAAAVHRQGELDLASEDPRSL
jgi:hypothetical protein